jgi:hypothetical protein
MKTSTKLIVIGTLVGLAATVRLVHAAQSQAPVVLMPEHHTGSLAAQSSDSNSHYEISARVWREI